MCARAVSCRSHPANVIDKAHTLYHTRHQVCRSKVDELSLKV